MPYQISTIISSTALIEGITLGAAVTVPTLAQDVVARLADSALRQIRNGNTRTLVDLALRFTASIITAGGMAFILSMPLATVVTINALFILTIGIYTVFFGNSFTIEIDDLLFKNSTLRMVNKEFEEDMQEITEERNDLTRKVVYSEKLVNLFRESNRKLLQEFKLYCQ